MAYTRDKGRDFWFDFDNQTLFQRTPEVTDALNRAYFAHGLNFDSVMSGLRLSFAAADHPTQFVALVKVGQQGFVDLAQIQIGIMLMHLEDAASIQSAFEDFGQGVLFDNRPGRPLGRRIHMMDGTPDTWVGYHRWHAFARAAILLGADANLWLHIDRCIALAWAIQTEANPTVDRPDNPGLPADRLQALRNAWMSLPVEKLDWAFVNHRTRAPMTSLLPEWQVELGRYARVQQILSDAAVVGSPQHLGADGLPMQRFWERAYADFMAITTVWGIQLIADPGPQRGERSGLVQMLKGIEPTFPGMVMPPPPNQPLSAVDIQFIQDWIDANCPEI
jgi:hypothetical protein